MCRPCDLFCVIVPLTPILQANHEILHFIANLEHETHGEELLTTIVPLKNILQMIQRALPCPLKRVKVRFA